MVAAAGAVVGKAYISGGKTRKKEKLNDNSDVQRLTCLKLENVLDWVENNIRTTTKCSLRILPNEATLKAFAGRLNLNEEDLSKCIYIIVIEDETNKTLLRKLVITQTISQELSALERGEMYTVPID